MESSFALWLNQFFAPLDGALLSLYHRWAEAAGVVLTPLMKFISLIGEKGLLFFLLAAALMLLPRRRKTGVCLFGAVCCGALITNLLLKDSVARLRPCQLEQFRLFWEAVGSPAEEGFSFPSGHATAAAAGCMALVLERGKVFLLPGGIYVLLTCLSRNYLMAHYPSDVLAGVLVGVCSAAVAYCIAGWIFRLLRRHRHRPLCRFLLYFDPLRLAGRKAGK